MTGTLGQLICKSLNTYKIHWSSQEAAARALYSASEDDLLTVSCFFVLQDISDLPRKKHCRDMDLLVSLQHAQSASEKPCN